MPEYYNSIIETLQKKADQAADKRKEINSLDDPQSWFYEDGYEDAIREAIDIVNEAIANSGTEEGDILKDLQAINYAIREAEICVERMQYDIGLMKEALKD